MTDLAHIRHLIHSKRWSTARAAASGDVVALEYVRAHAKQIKAGQFTTDFGDFVPLIGGTKDGNGHDPSYGYNGEGYGHGSEFTDDEMFNYGYGNYDGEGEGYGYGSDEGEGYGQGGFDSYGLERYGPV